jgi:ADP-ribose pyrophosphatase
MGAYEVIDNLPFNPFGRTGIAGRGVLGRYGPNHAADPIVSTWLRDDSNEIVKNGDSGRPILRILCIQRGDTKEIAIPGGMVDPGENVSTTLKREFVEETLNNQVASSELDEFFSGGSTVYKGYVDDPRNTDHAWMETVAVNFHDDDGGFLSKLNFQAGDDAIGIHWIEVSRDVKLYASHSKLIEETAELHGAHF